MTSQARTALDEHRSRIDRARLMSRLASLTNPCHESVLMRDAFGGSFPTDPLELYRAHFALFAELFDLQSAYASDGRYLHVHFMRTFLLPYPEAGRCRFYLEPGGAFCGAPAADGDYCEHHRTMVGDAELALLSERHFYLDPENYARLDGETAEAFISGAWELLYGFADFIEAFAVLGMEKTGDADTVKKRFRQLAKTHHPDTGGDPRTFNEINRAYRLVMHHMGAFDVFS